MKRISFFAAALTATVFAFVACSKENENPEQAPTTHSIRFVASGTDTKTSMSIEDGKAYFAWEDTDRDNIHIYESGEEAEVEASLDAEGKILSFVATFKGSSAPAGATYNAHLNSDIRTQSPSEGSYDGRCDVLSAALIDISEGRTAQVDIKFEREVSVNKMTIKGLGAGENVSSVTLNADMDIAGRYIIDEWTEKSTTLSINPAGVVSDEGGNAVIYFTCIPVADAQISVNVTTGEGAAQKTYRKTFAKTITLAKGGKRLGGDVLTHLRELWNFAR